jgi:hypothetical protein
MKVLVACEFSGTVRDAFIARGHEAMSCDLLPSLTEGPHYQGDIRDCLDTSWDLIIAHPPCTYLTVAGNRWYSDREDLQKEALAFVKLFADHPCPKIAIENPIGRLSTLWRKPDQIIQPWMFGHDAGKATCLWLKGLPLLVPTNIVEVEYVTFKSGKKWSKWYYETGNLKGDARRNARNKTFQGIADAFADQWGG